MRTRRREEIEGVCERGEGKLESDYSRQKNKTRVKKLRVEREIGGGGGG